MEARGHISILLTLALLAAITGCRKTDIPKDSAVAARAELDVQLSVDGGMSVSEEQTKSVVTGATLNENGRTYGLFACVHEDTPSEYKTYDYDKTNSYGNMQAYYSGGWNYSYASNTGARFKPLFFVTEDVSRHMDIYAYYPWKSGITIQSGYQYNLNSLSEGELVDLMYATYEDAGGTSTNRDITLVDKATIPLKINFHHALSRIVFHFKLANAQNSGLDGQHSITLKQIDMFKSNSSNTPLYSQGRMNILTGAVENIGLTNSIVVVTYNSSISKADTWIGHNMLVQPVEYQQDGDFSFRFYFNGNTYAQALNYQYEIKRSDLLHDDDTTYGFKPGYCYHFYFIIDNYIHLQNVLINTDWQLTDETEIKI